MGKGRKAKAVTPAPPSKPLPAQGRGGHKRTPTSAFDPAAGQDIYEPEKVVGERQKNLGGGKTETQYEVKWKGWDKKHNTYEPLSNLVGCEDMVSEYKERKRQRDAELGGAATRDLCRPFRSSTPVDLLKCATTPFCLSRVAGVGLMAGSLAGSVV